jgi:hypothetical protein
MDYIIKIFGLMMIIVVSAYLVKENGQEWTKDLNEGFSAFDKDYDSNGNVIYGYDADGKPIYQTYKTNFYSDYQKDNNFVEYHNDFTNSLDVAGKARGTAYVFDKNGNPQTLDPVSGALAIPSVYYQPKDFVYGSLSYVPNYQDSVYLSRTSNMNIEKPVVRTNSVQGGICNFYAKNPDQLETACNEIDEKVCASTSCCVLLGGAKCVSGNASGPTMKSNYSDTKISNRDYYYYQSKCYGNCPNQ